MYRIILIQFFFQPDTANLENSVHLNNNSENINKNAIKHSDISTQTVSVLDPLAPFDGSFLHNIPYADSTQSPPLRVSLHGSCDSYLVKGNNNTNGVGPEMDVSKNLKELKGLKELTGSNGNVDQL